jgi:colanic acid biosynthesis glycosyl transferase WcaI
VVLAMSPPLTLGVTGRIIGWFRRAPLVFNIQDVFPDAAVRTGAITSRRIIAAASRLERFSYHRSAAITVLSDDLGANVVAKMRPDRRDRVVVIPNFVDTEAISPLHRMTRYRRELGIGDEPVVLYAGNVGFSQSLDLVIAAAQRCPDVTFLINGDGAARPSLEAMASGMDNVRFAGYQPIERLGEVLATGDVHVVVLKEGLGDVSVPSKTYSSLAAGRPVVASIDPGTEIPRLLELAGAGACVAPGDLDGFVVALRTLVDDPFGRTELGEAGRRWVVDNASPAAVGEAYDRLLRSVAGRAGRRSA